MRKTIDRDDRSGIALAGFFRIASHRRDLRRLARIAFRQATRPGDYGNLCRKRQPGPGAVKGGESS